MKTVVPRVTAQADVDEALLHYSNEGGEELALRFVDAIESAFAHLGRHPASGSPRYAHELSLPDLRFWQLKRFPFLVFYVERPDHLDVWRVLHAERDIPAWLLTP